MKDVQATGKAFSPHKRTSLLNPNPYPADKNQCGSTRIRIRITGQTIGTGTWYQRTNLQHEYKYNVGFRYACMIVPIYVSCGTYPERAPGQSWHWICRPWRRTWPAPGRGGSQRLPPPPRSTGRSAPQYPPSRMSSSCCGRGTLYTALRDSFFTVRYQYLVEFLEIYAYLSKGTYCYINLPLIIINHAGHDVTQCTGYSTVYGTIQYRTSK